MEESHHQYLMWMKRKQIMKSHIQAPFGGALFNNNNSNSWEEKAFAEDAARRILGGCIWPPRSYSCNFCKREFRSAQALGGHMNVHRRDRARLKQQTPLICPNNNEEPLQHTHPKINDFTQEDFCHPMMIMSPYSSSISLGRQRKMGCPDSAEQKGLNINAKEEIIVKGFDCNINDCVETSLSVGKNMMMLGQKLPNVSCGDEGMISYKRPKTTCNISSLPVFLKPCFQSAEFVLGVKPGMEDLDLELRLGKPQKV